MSFALFASLAVLGLGIAILWANPSRWTNRMVGLCSVNVAAWLGALHFTLLAEEGLPFLRLTTAIGAFVPFSAWMVQEVIAEAKYRLSRRLVLRALPWAMASTSLAVVCYTNWFIPSYSTNTERVYGGGYYFYIGATLLLYLLIGWRTFVRMRTLSGLPRLEMQVWLLGGCSASLCILALMAIRSVVQVSLSLQPVIVLVFYSWTAVAITTYRIFDARHIFLVALQRGLLWATCVTLAWLSWIVLSMFLTSSVAFAATVAIMLWFSFWLNGLLDRAFFHYPNAIQARMAAVRASQAEAKTESLIKKFCSILDGWGQSEHSLISLREGESFLIGEEEYHQDNPALKSLRSLKWVTPERLERERETEGRRLLKRCMREHGLGVLLWQEGGGAVLLVGVGVRATRRPVTFPEVNQLKELATIFQTGLSRTEMIEKAQSAQQLATVGLLGASVAHEIRNPLVSIKTFTQLMPKHYDDPTFRERFSRLIGQEVSRIDRLTEQLLDLASPKNFQPTQVDLHAVVRESVEVVMARADADVVTIEQDLTAEPDVVLSDSNGLKQVLLNLCFNAVQAQESRRDGVAVSVRITTRSRGDSVELEVSDNGPGIPPEARAQLFEPFHSTKSKGFGLGLTVCRDILSSLGSTIILDPYQPGKGATFRIQLPCPHRSY
ncbi:sensor histidine kinase [Actomonas aquatica]|uniref:histidine kinase n=1 Tax=Actomonas aquatica TaxID=2866162 RepID=A0ABZ1CAV3_9BACT|nr:ATP-binding protein [Opitutus sp. WL0086]WRQ88780.1 ATP-binding protein [Opitutus sp. WL0086]